MSKPHLLSVEESAALGAKLSQVEVCASHPMPFSVSIADELRKIHACQFIDCGSLSASVNAAIGASLGGKRAFVPTSIPRSIEDIFTAAYMRLPLVIANISRPLGVYSIKHDHSDITALLDSGCLIFMPESNQDLVESIVQAYKVSEEIMLPSIVNVDLTGYREQVISPDESFTRRFVGRFRSAHNFDRKSKYFALPDDNYADFKKQQHKAIKNSVEVIDKTSRLWQKKYRKSLPLIESYKLEDADLAIVISGFHSTTAKAAVDKLRSMGKKVGLLRIRVLRPWPSDAIVNSLKNVKRIAVFDQAVSLGRYGILYREINDKNRLSNFISLGKYPGEKDFLAIVGRLEKSGKDEIVWV
jgi:pyruvate/2-oxoacid:ferredoxin oxidoreductase alpha subunit